MANNQFMIKRTAFAHLVHPGHASATGNTSNTGVYIPAGAIVTGMRILSGGAVTGGASLSNAVFGISVGAISIASNNNVQSAKIVQTIPKSLTLAVTADGILVGTGGELKVEYVSTGTAATGVTADYDLYVDYLYCPDHD